MKSILTRGEFLKWLQYNRYKKPDIAEIQMAILMSMVARGMGSKKAKPDDYIISNNPQSKEELKEMDANDVMSLFGSLSHLH